MRKLQIGLGAAFFNSSVTIFTRIWRTGEYFLHRWIYSKSNLRRQPRTCSVICRSSVIYFSFQPVLHDWCNKGCGMCYPVCGMVHIKEPLLLIGKSSLCGGSGFPFSLSEWSLTICLTPYNRK